MRKKPLPKSAATTLLLLLLLFLYNHHTHPTTCNALPQHIHSTSTSSSAAAEKKKKKKRTLANRRTTPPPPTLLPLSAKQQQQHNRSSSDDLSIESLLKRKKSSALNNSIRNVRLLCLTLMFHFGSECLRSSGQLYQQTIEAMGLQMNDKNKELIQLIAQQMARASGEILPSPLLPNWSSLLGLLLSISAYVVTLIIPKLSMKLRVASEYDLLPFDKDKCTEYEESIGLGGYDGLAVLVNVPRKERIKLEEDQVICEIRKVSDESLCVVNFDDDDKRSTIEEKLLYHPSRHYIELNQRRIYLDLSTGRCFDGAPSLFSKRQLELKEMQDLTKGVLTNDTLLKAAVERYGPYTTVKIEHPTLVKLFLERITTPLSILKICGQVVSLLEEHLGRCLFEIMSSLGQYLYSARQSITLSKEMLHDIEVNEKEASEKLVKVLRTKKLKSEKKKKANNLVSTVQYYWTKTSADNLLPGDLFSMNESSMTPFVMPVDALIVKGNCICNEAVITGESVPQNKIPLAYDDDATFDMNGLHRSSVVFAGSTVLSCSEESDVKFMTLRNGSYSSRGELLRLLTKNQQKGIDSDVLRKDANRLIMLLTLFGVMACSNVVWDLFPFIFCCNSHARRKVSPFRLIIQCIRILVASVPSTIPLVVSQVTNSFVRQLREDADIVTISHGCITKAPKVTTAIFDKTGTITADTQRMVNISHYDSAHPMALACLASSHSLVRMGESWIGDPVDLASFQYSRFDFNATDNSFTSREDNTKSSLRVKKLWKLISFPFDPTKRMSSAVLLVLHEDNNYRLWKVLKGSPDEISKIYDSDNQPYNGSGTFNDWFSRELHLICAEGNRALSTCVEDITNNEEIVRLLFADGIPHSTEFKLETALSTSSLAAKKLSRSDIERPSEKAIFTGIAYFNAPTRKSSMRVIKSLKKHINVCMLTGDNLDAATSVAVDVGLISRKQKKNRSVYILSKCQSTSNAQISRAFCVKKIKSLPLTEKILSRFAGAPDAVFVVSGEVLDVLISEHSVNWPFLPDILRRVIVVGSATPQLKEKFVVALNDIGERMIMCGDGVNDISAMKNVDLSLALLSGHGNESDSKVDWEDLRRRENLKKRKREVDKFHEAGLGSSAQASQARIRQKITDAIEKVKSEGNEADIEGVKLVFKEWLAAFKYEQNRARIMKKGGSEAAKVIAKDERLKRSLLEKTGDVTGIDDATDQIKPGEVSSVSTFTTLRPSIDGVEYILRYGRAAVANILTHIQILVLETLLSCHSMSALYRAQVRYSKLMWPTFNFLFSSLYMGTDNLVSPPNPTMASWEIKPSISLFNARNMLSTLLQGAIHITSLNFALGDDRISSREGQKGFRLHHQLATNKHTDHANKNYFANRIKFSPNKVTNRIYLLSVYQSLMIILVNIKGRPFSLNLLEMTGSGHLTAITIIFAFCVCATLETIPMLNKLLGLAPMDRQDKVSMILIFLLNSLACFAVDCLASNIFEKDLLRIKYSRKKDSKNQHKKQNKKQRTKNNFSAAEEEELYLSTNKSDNIKVLCQYGALLVLIALKGLFSIQSNNILEA